MSIFSKKNILILVGIVLFLTFFTVAIPKEKSIGFESKSIESVVVINGNETEVLEEGLADVFKSIGDITIKLVKWFMSLFADEPDCNSCNCTQNQACAEKCNKCQNSKKSATEIVKKKLKDNGYTYYRGNTTCEDVGITGTDENSLAACYAFSQYGFKVSGSDTKAKNAYASSKGWCCKFVKWAYSMAGKEVDCYDGDVAIGNLNTNKQKDGLVMATSEDNGHIGIAYKREKANGKYEWWLIHGNWGTSRSEDKYSSTYVEHSIIGDELPDKYNMRGLGSEDVRYILP